MKLSIKVVKKCKILIKKWKKSFLYPRLLKWMGTPFLGGTPIWRDPPQKYCKTWFLHGDYWRIMGGVRGYPTRFIEKR